MLKNMSKVDIISDVKHRERETEKERQRGEAGNVDFKCLSMQMLILSAYKNRHSNKKYNHLNNYHKHNF